MAVVDAPLPRHDYVELMASWTQDAQLNDVEDLKTDPSSACFLLLMSRLLPNQAIKQRKPTTLKDVEADQIDIYSQEARSPRLLFLLAPSLASDSGRLERGNASKARRPLCAGTPVSPALGYGDDRLFLRDAC